MSREKLLKMMALSDRVLGLCRDQEDMTTSDLQAAAEAIILDALNWKEELGK
jgi:hypothetical protein